MVINEPRGSVRIGIDLGNQQDSTAIAIVEAVPSAHESHYLVRDVGRLPLGIGYVQITQEIVRTAVAVRERGFTEPHVYIDSTGLGAVVSDVIAPKIAGLAHLHRVTLVAGDNYYQVATQHDNGRPRRDGSKVSVGKQWVAGRLKALLGTGRIIGAASPEFGQLQQELLGFEQRAGTRDTLGAAGGAHDDMVIALALAVLEEEGGGDLQSLADLNRRLRGGAIADVDGPVVDRPSSLNYGGDPSGYPW